MNELESGSYDATKYFSEKNANRNIFLRKVYALLTLQLLTAIFFVYASTSCPQFQQGLLNNWPAFLAQFVLLIVLLLAVFSSRNAFRKSPYDVIAYIIFSQSLIYCLAYVAALSGNQVVLMMVTLAALLTFSLTIYALTAKKDLSYLGGTIYVFGSGLFGYEMFLIASDLAIPTMVYVVLLNIVFGFYLIYDTQFIITGETPNKETENSFVGAIAVYMDMILIFIRLIEKLGGLFKKNAA